MLNFNFDDLATSKAAKKVAQLFQRAGAPVIETTSDPKIRRTAGVSYREMNFTHADGQTTTLRVNKTGDVAQLLVNGALVPIKNQSDVNKAIGEIAGRLEAGRAKFQAKLSRTKVELPKGIKTAAPKLEQKLTEEVQRLDTLIAERTTQLNELKAKLDPVLDGVYGTVTLCAAISEALELAGVLSTVALDSVDYGAAKVILHNALEVVQNNWPINMAEGNVAQAEAEQDAAKSIRDALAVLDGVRGKKEDPLLVVVRDEGGIVLRMSSTDFMTAMKREGMPSKTFLEEAIKVYNEHKKKIGSTMRAEVVLVGGKKVLDAARKNNQKGYAFYVVVNNKIESGWEYKEDAQEHAADNLPSSMKGKVFAKSSVIKAGLNPDDNSSWLVYSGVMDNTSSTDASGVSVESDTIILDESDDEFNEDGSADLFDGCDSDDKEDDNEDDQDDDLGIFDGVGVYDSVEQNEQITEELAAIVDQEWPLVPAGEINKVLAGHGFTVIDDNGNPWLGEMPSEEGQDVLNLQKDGVEISEQLTVQWQKMPSGKYQIAAYLS